MDYSTTDKVRVAELGKENTRLRAELIRERRRASGALAGAYKLKYQRDAARVKLEQIRDWADKRQFHSGMYFELLGMLGLNQPPTPGADEGKVG